MNILRGSFAIVVGVMAAAIMLGSACAPSPPPPPPTPPPAPSVNKAPTISSLTANPAEVSYGGSSTLTCIANDPDGDIIKYSWSATDGSISGTGNSVTWVAPKKDGDFNITITISDGKGGQAKGDVMVTVAAAVRTVTITPVAGETGTVSADGFRDTSRTLAGDDAKNIGYRAFWSFDISSLAGKDIQHASLKFTTGSITGLPFQAGLGLGGLWLWKATYGAQLPEFGYTGSQLALTSSGLMMQPPTVIDVTLELGQLASFDISRFQIEALFTKPSNGEGAADWIEWSEVVLDVTYSEK